MGKAVLLMLIGSISIAAATIFNISSRLNEVKEDAVGYYAKNQAQNICNSTVSMLMSQIADSTTYRVHTPQTKNLFGGTATYSVTEALLTGYPDSLIQINVTAVYFGDTSSAVTYCRDPGGGGGGYVPGPVKAAISTNNPVSTTGGLIVDGRDHDLSGNLISNSGTLGIWTTGTVSQGGSSTIGSTDSLGFDHAPQGSAASDPDIVQQNKTWAGGYPDNPDKVLGGVANGFPDGTLKAMAQSGVNGSQYVTDPSSLTYPLSGITYVEIPHNSKPNKRTWNSMDITGSGVLIVHNSSCSAIMKNLNSGTFKGMIIADDIIHIHANVIGAVIGLTPSPSDGNCIGNGNGTIKFSRQAIEDATGLAMGGGGGGGEAIEYGFGRQRVEVVLYYE